MPSGMLRTLEGVTPMAQTYIQERMAKRQGLVAAARAISDKALAEKRELTAAEQTEYDKLDADIKSLRSHIDRLVDEQESTRQMEEALGDGLGGGGRKEAR